MITLLWFTSVASLYRLVCWFVALPLIGSVLQVSPEELEQLWNKYAARLRLLIRIRSDFAEDCVQEAFVRLSQQTDTPLDPLAWLARVARNLALTEIRNNRRRTRRETDKARQQTGWFAEDSQSSQTHHPNDVESALQKLSLEFRELVIAIVWNQMTFRQAADAFGMAPATLQRRYMEALDQLRHNLSPKSPQEGSPSSCGLPHDQGPFHHE